jgi:hypothetical protein
MPSKAPDQRHFICANPAKEIAPSLDPRVRNARSSRVVGTPLTATLSDPRLAASEIRREARSLRELLLWDLREQGYCLREIAGVLGLTRQRVSQLETGMIRRAVISKSRTFNPFLDPRKIAWKRNTSYVKLVTFQEFEKRVDALNARYAAHLKRILKRFYWRQMTWTRHGPCPSTLFRKVWPLLERYQEKPFNFSKLIEDFPALAQEPYVSQLLSRLRRQGLLRKVGSVRKASHNLPEVLMVRTSWEESAETQIEKLASVWSRKLLELEARYQSIRPNQALRGHIREILRKQDRPTFDFDKSLGLRPAELIRTKSYPREAEKPRAAEHHI